MGKWRRVGGWWKLGSIMHARSRVSCIRHGTEGLVFFSMYRYSRRMKGLIGCMSSPCRKEENRQYREEERREGGILWIKCSNKV